MKDPKEIAKYINHNPILKIVLILAIFVVPITLLVFIGAALFDMIQIGTGCLKRYGPDGTSQTLSQSVTINVNANGNYDAMNFNGTAITPTATSYGNWLVTNIKVNSGDSLNISVNGAVSLCRASLLANNIHTSPNHSNGTKILLPKVEENDSSYYNYTADPMILNYGVPITFPANQNQWLNLAQLEKNDNIQVFIYPQYNSNPTSVFNVFQSPGLTTSNLQKYTANCSNGQTSYNAICGLYSFYSGSYATSCTSSTTPFTPNSYKVCNGRLAFEFFGDDSTCCECGCTENGRSCVFGCGSACVSTYQPPTTYTTTYSVATSQAMPIAYNGSNAFPPLNTSGYSCNPPNQMNGPCCQGIGLDANECTGCKCWTKLDPNNSLSTLLINYTHANNGHNENQCCAGYRDNNQTPDTSCTSDYYNSSTKNFWMTGGNGLLYQISSNSNNGNQMGSSYTVIPQNNATFVPMSIYKVNNFVTRSTEYLQYYFYDNGNANSNKSNLNTGGVVLGIKQTKCVRINGVPRKDSSSGNVATGAIKYIILTNASDTIVESNTETLSVDVNGKSQNAAAHNTGYLALKIANIDSQYQNSTGQYNLTISYNSTLTSFNSILDNVIQDLRSITMNLSKTIIGNLICYKHTDQSKCINFFTYVKAILTLYIMVYAMMFVLGFVEISQYDLVIRIAKIAIVSGLITGGTFTYFTTYIFPILYNATDELIANIGGYVPFDTNLANSSSLNNIRKHNPMEFLDELFSKIFFSKTFLAQTISLLGIGLSGIIYFYIMLATIIIVVITLFKAILVYIFSFMGLAIMIAIAPIILTFVLFSFTSSVFSHWLNALFRYIMEPVILMMGIIILTQLFTVFLDFTLNFSVCWKCTLPINLPFFGLEKFLGAVFLNHPLFCIYWYSPWGIDPVSYSASYPMSNYIMLFIISYTMYGYIKIAEEVSQGLCVAGSSAINSAIKMTDNTMKSFGKGLGKTTGLDAKTLDKKIDAVAGGKGSIPKKP